MHEDDTGPPAMRILIVDDNHDAALSMAMLLELEGHQTGVAHNGRDAVHAATRVRYDAVLLDLGMPVMNGFEAAALIGRLRPAPLLIACTAWDDAETRRRTTELGFSAHLTKPVPLDVLRAALVPAGEPASGCRGGRGGEVQGVAHPDELRQ